jgi:hypothetical protein
MRRVLAMKGQAPVFVFVQFIIPSPFTFRISPFTIHPYLCSVT